MRFVLTIFTLFLGAALAQAQTTQPAETSSPASVQLRATQAFSRGEFATALPLLKKVADQLKGQPDRIGQVQEQIRVCQKNLDMASQAQPQQAVPVDTGPRKPHVKPG